MKRLSLFPALVLAASASAFAGPQQDNKAFFNDMLKLDRERHSVLSTPDFAGAPVLSDKDSAYIAVLKKQQQQQGRPDAGEPAAMVFVSFSMPEDELRTRVSDAATLGVPVVLRGMVNGDMRQTGNRVAQLVKDTGKGGVQIEPVAFRRYGITSVPVLLVTCDGKSDRVQGDIDLGEALKKVAQDGDCAGFAQDVLNRGSAHE